MNAKAVGELKIRGPRCFKQALESNFTLSDVLEAARRRGTWSEGELVEVMRECGLDADLRHGRAVKI